MLRAVGPHHLHLVALGGGPVAAAEVEFVLRELRLSAASDGARAGSASWPSGTRSAAVVVLPIPSKKFSDSPGMCVAKVRELLLDRAAPAALRARWAVVERECHVGSVPHAQRRLYALTARA